MQLPQGFLATLADIRASIVGVEGWLTDRELEFLALLAACPTAEGEVLELGCYHGKSTIVLAKALAHTDRPRLITVDPLAGEMLPQNLRRAKVADRVEAHAAYSTKVVADWNRPLRLLWHDGANDRATVENDLAGLLPHLANRAIVAMHDVLNPSGDRIYVYMNDILGSPNFGPVGICGSIGWAQYQHKVQAAASHAREKAALRRKLQTIAPFHSHKDPNPHGFARVYYRLMRSRVRHGRIEPQQWLSKVA
jgi:predicted O-methyltransferase YrrM